MDSQSSDPPELAGETSFFRAVLQSRADCVIGQGLPKHYFAHYERALAAAGGEPRPVFISISGSAAADVARTGAECYALRSLPGLDREAEIRAYEQAHERIAEAYRQLPVAERELALLVVDNDLPIIASAVFFADIREYLADRFAGRPAVIPMRNRDDTYRVFAALMDVREVDVRGDYKAVTVTDLPRKGLGAEAGSPPAQEDAEAGEALLAHIDTWAREHWTDDPRLVDLVADESKPNVLVHAQYPSSHFSFASLMRVAERVAERGARPIVIPRDAAAGEHAAARGLPVLLLDAVEPMDDPQWADTLASLPLTAWPYEGLRASKGWIKRLRSQLSRYSAAAKIARALEPKSLLIYPYGAQSSRVLNLAATRQGIPVYETILLGLGGHARGFPVIDDHTTFLAYGTEATELMEAFGVAPHRLIVTGNPRYDPVTTHRERREAYRRRFLAGADPKAPIAVVASTGLLELDRQWLDAACRSAGELGMRLVIKPHPSLGAGPYQPWVQPHPHVDVWEGSLDEIASACDVLLTDYSSTGWEAVLYNRPMIVVNFSGNEFRYRWEDEGVGVRVSDAQQLHKAFASAADGTFAPDVLECQRRITPRYNHLNDGKAAERMAALLLQRRRPLTSRVASWARRIRARRVARRLLKPGRAGGSDVR